MRSLKLFASSLIFLSGLPSQAQRDLEEPDYAKEAQLHRVFKKFNEQPTSDEVWKSSLSKGHTQSYRVQKKDTLWGVSQTLFGEPGYWPKIWSLNGELVLNPHEILPDQQIHFTEGTFGEPPTVAVKEGMPEESTPAPVELEMPTVPVSQDLKPVIPDGEVKEAELPLAKVASARLVPLPNSLPDWEALTGLADFKLALRPLPVAASHVDQALTFYISENAPSEVEGVISETEQGTAAASDIQYIYIKFNQAPSRSRFVVFQNLGQVADPWQKKDGHLIQILGEIEVLELANPAKNLYRARSIQNFSHFLVGAQVMASEVTLINTSTGTDSAPIPAQIIGGGYDIKRTLFGPQELVFLNSGAASGVQPGQSFVIYKNQKMRIDESDVEANALVVGRLKVVKVTEQFSTALVVEASDEVNVGDFLEPKIISVKAE